MTDNVIFIRGRTTLNLSDRRQSGKIEIDAHQLRQLVLTARMTVQFLDMAMADNGQASVLSKLWASQLEQFRKECQKFDQHY